MDFKNQSEKLPVLNFDLFDDQKKKTSKHGPLLPNSIRAVFCGPSNCGKTNTLLTLIAHPNGLRFSNVYVYSKSLNQPKYKFLEQMLDSLDDIQYFPFSEHEEVVSPDNVLPDSVMIFDDVACEKQDNIRAFFCMGRHKGVDCFYLCQSYTRIPKHLVRDNVNMLVLFKQDDTNLKHVYDDHVNSDMTFTKFKELCNKCWKNDRYGFIVIDRDSPVERGRYRQGFDKFGINRDCSK